MSARSPNPPPFDPAYKFSHGIPGASPDLDIKGMRSTINIITAEFILAKIPDIEHKQMSIPGVADFSSQSVELSIFQTKSSQNRKRAVLLYIHGGGLVAGNRFFGLEGLLSMLPLTDDFVLMSVEYRLAPEHRAPAQTFDVYAALAYISAHANELGIDSDRIVTYGVSGGAGPVVAAALLARQTRAFKISAQVLSVPMLDNREEYTSYKQFETETLWSGRINRQAWRHVLGSDEDTNVTELQVPARAKSLVNLPATYIDVGECEVFRDQAVAFAARILADGGSCELHVWPGMYHAASSFEPDVAVSKRAQEALATFLRSKLGLEKQGGGEVKSLACASL